MKTFTVSTTLALALATSVQAAPANVVGETQISKRQEEQLNELSLTVREFSVKRATIEDPVELQRREYEIVTQILSAINLTNLATKLIQGLVDNKKLQPLVTDAIIALIKSGKISLKTLFTSLNDSGLATRVIKDLINDCSFYQDIFKLAKQEISNLVQKLEDKIKNGLLQRDLDAEFENFSPAHAPDVAKRYDDNGVVNQLLESLANSGMASSVVRALVVDPQFLKYGVDLFKELWDKDLINWKGLISAISDSGLVTSLFKEFLNLDTLKTVIENALAAAFNKCGGSTISGTPTGLTTQSTSTTVLPTFTATGTSVPSGSPNCQKRRKRRSYNY